MLNRKKTEVHLNFMIDKMKPVRCKTALARQRFQEEDNARLLAMTLDAVAVAEDGPPLLPPIFKTSPMKS